MRWTVLLAPFLLVGCGTDTPPPVLNLAPAATAVAGASVHISSAEVKAKHVEETGAVPHDPEVQKLVLDLDAAQTAAGVAQDALASEQQTAQKIAQEDAQIRKDNASYRAAIARRNIDLLIAIFVGASVFFVGSVAKDATLYTAALPGPIAGYVATLAFIALAALIITFWSTFGWLIHFL
jgi:hypothetical protein